MKRRWIIFLLLATGLGWLLLREMPRESELISPKEMFPSVDEADRAAAIPTEPADRTKSAVAAGARGAIQSGAGPAASIGPPPANAPAVTQIRYWREAARGGDAFAQCQYAHHAVGCLWSISGHTRWARARRESEMASAIDAGEIIDCRGLELSELDPAFDALLRSAQQGMASAQFMFAAGFGLSPWGDVRHPERLVTYRTEAPQLAWRAFAAGDSDAAVLLWRAYNRVRTDFVYLAAAIDPDPVKAHALDLLMGDLVPGFVVGTAAEAGLSKAQAAQAEAMRAEWRATAFAHGRPPRYGMEIERLFDWDQRAMDLCAPDPR